MIREGAAEELKAELVRLLQGNTTYLESAIHIWRLSFDFHADDDPDFAVFQGIASETDHLPIGVQRQYWSEEALMRKDPEISSADVWARSFGEAAAQNLLRRYCK